MSTGGARILEILLRVGNGELDAKVAAPEIRDIFYGPDMAGERLFARKVVQALEDSGTLPREHSEQRRRKIKRTA